MNNPQTNRTDPELAASQEDSIADDPVVAESTPTPGPAVDETFVRQETFLGREIYKYMVSALILGGGAFAMWGLSQWKPEPEPGTVDESKLMVNVYQAENYAGQLDMVVAGSVVPFREIKVASEVDGVITEKYPACYAGNFVTKGTRLLEIDQTGYKIVKNTIEKEIIQAQKTIAETDAEIGAAKRNIILAQREYQLQKRDYERNRRLQGVLSGTEIDAAEQAMLTKETQLEGRKNTLGGLLARRERLVATLELTRSRLAQVELDLSRTTIFAPASGVIVTDLAEEGETVNIKMQLLTLEDNSHVEVLCNLSNSDLDWIRRNADPSTTRQQRTISITAWPENVVSYWAAIQLVNSRIAVADSVYVLPRTDVSIYEPDQPNVQWRGVLERFDGIGRDERTRTTPCRIVVNNPVVYSGNQSHALVRGTFVKCSVEVRASAGDSDRRFLTFPEIAVQPGNVVWIVRDGKLDRVDVQIVDRTKREHNGREDASYVIVRLNEDGLQENDEIVVTPLPQPTIGAEIIYQDKSRNADNAPDESGTEAQSASKGGMQ